MSDSNRTQLYYGIESVYGVTPAVAFQEMRFTGEGLNKNIENILSNEIRSDRQVTDLIQVDADVTGSINFELSYGAFDDFLVAALYSAGWSTTVAVSATDISAANADNSFNTVAEDFTTENIAVGQWIEVRGFSTNPTNNGYFKVVSVAATKLVVSGGDALIDETAGDTITMAGSMIRNGVTETSFTLEKEFSDKAQFFLYNGMIVGTMGLNFNVKEILAGTMGFEGKSLTVAQTTASTGAPSAAASNQIMNSVSHFKRLREGGSEINTAASYFVSDVGVNLSNALRPQKALGVLGSTEIGAGRATIEGTLKGYFEDETFVNKFLNGTETSLDWYVEDNAGNAYYITLPRIKLATLAVNAQGIDQDVLLDGTYQALRDPTTDCMIQIDKFAA